VSVGLRSERRAAMSGRLSSPDTLLLLSYLSVRPIGRAMVLTRVVTEDHRNTIWEGLRSNLCVN